ncbi:MAG: RNA polymerase sigma factor [Terracidiphilus sp.]
MPSTMRVACIQSDPAVREGKFETFLQLAEQRRAQLLWYARRITNNREEAEDIVQEALLRAFKNLSRFRGESQMGTWLCVIVQTFGRATRAFPGRQLVHRQKYRRAIGRSQYSYLMRIS